MDFNGLSVSDSFEFIGTFLNFVKLLKLFLLLIIVDRSYNGNDSHGQQNTHSLQPESLSLVRKEILHDDINNSCYHQNDEHLIAKGILEDLKERLGFLLFVRIAPESL